MSVVERGFDVRDHEIIQRVYLAAWTRLATNNPVRTPEEEAYVRRTCESGCSPLRSAEPLILTRCMPTSWPFMIGRASDR